MKKNSLFILLIILLGFFFRFYRFDTIPFGLNHDGAQDALQAISILQHPLPYKVYFAGGSGETLFKYYLALTMHLFGISVWTIKFASTFLSFLTIPIFYLLAKKLTKNRYIAFSATFLLAISGWHIIMGKTVWRAISTPLLETATLYFLLQALEKETSKDFALTGFFLALTLNTYNAARSLLIFIPVVLLAGVFIRKKLSSRLLTNLLIFFAVFIITIYPLAKYALNNWAEFNSRLSSTSVFSNIKQVGNLSPLLDNIKTTALIFNVRANGDDFFTSQPLLDQPAAILFIVGIIFCLLKIKKPENTFLLAGLIINSLPGLLSVPNGNRIIATLPFVYLIAGLGFYQLKELLQSLFKKNMLIVNAVIFLVFIYGVFNTYHIYFGKNRRELFGFYPETTIVGNFMKSRINRFDFYLTDNYPRDSLTFLTYSGGDPFVKHYTWFEKKEDFLAVKKTPDKGIIFVMFDTDENLQFIRELKEKFPDGKLHQLRSTAFIFVVEKI